MGFRRRWYGTSSSRSPRIQSFERRLTGHVETGRDSISQIQRWAAYDPEGLRIDPRASFLACPERPRLRVRPFFLLCRA